MKKISIILALILLSSILVFMIPVSAATHHIYPDDDIVSIVGAAASGDTIYIHAGTYYVNSQINIPASYITIIGDSPFNTIIDATSSGGYGIYTDHEYVTIKNITLRNAPLDGFVIDNYGTIENCIAYANEYSGFEANSNCTLKNCLSYNNGGNGFSDEDFSTYINCTSVNNGFFGFINEDGGAKVINCISVGNTLDGFYFDNNYPSEILYSNSWGNIGDDYDDTTKTASISSDPKFITGRLGDYYLGYSSPCVDSGSDQSITLDLYNGFTTRVDEKWDVGKVDMGFHYTSNRGPKGSIPIMKILEILKKNKNK
ncbi:MAG: hypothetical protein HPY60_01035 [Candidatus Methanofastidiosum sp.]|nr:hypothetical protein [Methanofastidiosum sp.]